MCDLYIERTNAQREVVTPVYKTVVFFSINHNHKNKDAFMLDLWIE